jgi:hypothetical protein
VSEVRALTPITEEDYARVRDYIMANRAGWERHLTAGLQELVNHLGVDGYVPSAAEERPYAMAGRGTVGAREVLVSDRLKETGAIVAKMRRFGEPLRLMLDVWGYRAVVATESALDDVAVRCAELWEEPTPPELLLRHGTLQFDWWRDYRRRNHAGLSAATTPRYDHAIHLNRRATFGIVEIQVLTFDLYRRAHCDPASNDSHDRFVARREELLRGDDDR